MMRLIVVGSVLVDVTVHVPHLPAAGGDVIGLRQRIRPGGGFNVLAQARRMGMAAAYAGRVGSGPLGSMVRDALSAIGVPLLIPHVSKEDSGFVVAMVDRSGQPTYVTAPGVESRLRPQDLNPVQWEPDDALYISGYDLSYQESGATIVRWLTATDNPIPIICDPGPLADRISDSYLQSLADLGSILTLNAREVRLLTGIDHAIHGIHDLSRRFQTVVVRDGAHGAFLARHGVPAIHIPARPAQVVDATGAGDIHTATLMWLLSQSWKFEQAVRGANIAASLAVELEGSSMGPDFEALMQEWIKLGDVPAQAVGREANH